MTLGPWHLTGYAYKRGKSLAESAQVAAKIERLTELNAQLVSALEELSGAVRWHFVPLVETYAGASAAHAKDDAIDRARNVLKRVYGEPNVR